MKMQTLVLAFTLIGATLTMATRAGAGPPRPRGPCDIYDAAGAPCVAAHSTTRALYAAYNGPLYQVLRQSDGKTLNIGVVQPADSPAAAAGVGRMQVATPTRPRRMRSAPTRTAGSPPSTTNLLNTMT